MSILQVAERTLFLWNNETVVVRITEHRDRVIPIVFGALATNTAGHWNSTVHGMTLSLLHIYGLLCLLTNDEWRSRNAIGLTYNVQKLLMEMDSDLYDQCAQQHEEKLRQRELKEAGAQRSWDAVIKMAEE